MPAQAEGVTRGGLLGACENQSHGKQLTIRYDVNQVQ